MGWEGEGRGGGPKKKCFLVMIFLDLGSIPIPILIGEFVYACIRIYTLINI